MTRHTISRSDTSGTGTAATGFLLLFFGIWFTVGSVLTFALLLAFPGWAKLAALFPLIFALIGAGGLWFALRSKSRSPERILAYRSPIGKELASELPIPKLKTFMGRDLPVRLAMDSGSRGGLGTILFVNLFWNGIVGVFVGVALFTDQFPGIVWVFLSPFILVGGFLLLALLKEVLISIRIPVTVVEINQEPAIPGETLRVKISQEGSFILDSINVELVCEERISYTRGTDTYREERKVWSETLVTANTIRIEGGRPWRDMLEFTVPAIAMHSFYAEHNEVAWRIVVTGCVKKWPNYEYSFPFRVMPVGVREQMSWNRQSLSA